MSPMPRTCSWGSCRDVARAWGRLGGAPAQLIQMQHGIQGKRPWTQLCSNMLIHKTHTKRQGHAQIQHRQTDVDTDTCTHTGSTVPTSCLRAAATPHVILAAPGPYASLVSASSGGPWRGVAYVGHHLRFSRAMVISHNSCLLSQLCPVPGWLPAPVFHSSRREAALGLQNKTFILSGYGTNVVPTISEHWLLLGLQIVPLFGSAVQGVPDSRLSPCVVGEHHVPQTAVVQGPVHCAKDGTR